MNLKTIATSLALFASATAFAATAKVPEGVTESTDPAKAAAVERHAQEIKMHQQESVNASGTGSKKATKHHKRAKKTAAAKA